jgi:flagellar biosynthesis protein FlhB
MSSDIKRRDDVSPKEGEHKYGDVKFADTTNNKYPIDTPEHIRAAWSYINHKDNAAKYSPSEVKTIKSRIKRAAKKHDIEIDEDK